MATFTESLRMNELAISVKIWYDYEQVLTREAAINKTLHAIVQSFVISPCMQEAKMFFMMQVF